MLLYFKQYFDTVEVILQQPGEYVFYFYSTTASKRAELFAPYKNEVSQSVT